MIGKGCLFCLQKNLHILYSMMPFANFYIKSNLEEQEQHVLNVTILSSTIRALYRKNKRKGNNTNSRVNGNSLLNFGKHISSQSLLYLLHTKNAIHVDPSITELVLVQAHPAPPTPTRSGPWAVQPHPSTKSSLPILQQWHRSQRLLL